MRLTLNGEARDVEDIRTVEDLVRSLEIHRMIVVQRNGEIIRRERFAQSELSDGDVIEIVHFVGGG